jgi:drug/metabolite transporter (DMT)-like permease
VTDEQEPARAGLPPHRGGDGPGVTVLLIALGVLGISFSAPLVVAISAPALAVAFWRNAFGAFAIAPYVALRGRDEWRGIFQGDRRPLVTAVGAGVALAVHFSLWIPSLRMTTVTASTALVTTTPVWTVVLDKVRGRPVPPGVIVGVGVAMAGMLLITGVDAGRSGRALLGDLLALLGGMAAAVYVSAGESARRWMSTASYTFTAYTICAFLLLGGCLVGRQRVHGEGYDARTWGLLLLLTLCAQLVGHTLLNRALAAVGATTVSLSILLETPGAALVAWVWLGQEPPALIIPGAALVLAGIAIVVVSRRVTNVTVTDAPPPG